MNPGAHRGRHRNRQSAGARESKRPGRGHGSLVLGARLKGERVGVSLPGLCWSILQWVGGGVGAAPTRGAEAAALSLRGRQGAGRRVPSWQTCHARSAWREPGPRALHSQPTAQGSQDTVLPRALPLCVPLVPLRLPPGVPAPFLQWDVSLAFREPLRSACDFPPGDAR